MNFSKSISFSIIILLVFTTIMAITGIRGFLRLAPSVEQINSHHTQSFYLTEKMMSTLALESNINSFEAALNQAKKNTTELEEKEKIKNIEKNYKAAFAGSKIAKESVIKDILGLSEINRLATEKTAEKTKKLSFIGAWGIAFMGILICFLGLIILKTLKRIIILPLAELKDVFHGYSKGNKLRRCPEIAPSKDFQQIYDEVNYLLDKLNKKK